MDPISLGAGAAGVAGVVAIWKLASHYLPVAWAAIKSTLGVGAGKTLLATLQADLGTAQTKVAALETGAVATLQSDMTAAKADIAKLKAHTGVQ